LGVKDRRVREKEQLRQRILQEARALFLDEGYDRVTIRRIADAVEYAPGTIYLYFEDKDQIFLEICEESFGELVERFRALERSESPLERVRAGLRAYILYGIENPQAYELLFVMRTGVSKHRKEREGGKGHEALQYLVSAVVDGQRQGLVRQEDPVHLALALWAAAHGITHLVNERDFGQEDWPEDHRREVIELLLDVQVAGLRA
jgi:AcrR family transcriptional regulator